MTTFTEFDQRRAEQLNPRRWKAKASLVATVGVPLAVAGFADPAAAQFEDTESADFGIEDQVTPGYETLGYEAPGEEALGDGGISANADRYTIDDYSRDSSVENYGGAEHEIDNVGFHITAVDHFDSGVKIARNDSDADGGFGIDADDTFIDTSDFIDKSDFQGFSAATNSELREFYVPDGARAEDDNFSPSVLSALEQLAVEPEHSYTLKPGRYHWDTSLKAADVLDELGQSDKAHNLRQRLADGQIAGFYHNPTRFADGMRVGRHAVIDANTEEPRFVEFVVHESTHIDQYESAEPGDEIEAYAIGALASSWYANKPETLGETLAARSRTLTRTYPEYEMFEATDIESAMAAETIEFLPASLPADWKRARSALKDRIVDQSVSETQIRNVLRIPNELGFRHSAEPDGSVLVQTSNGGHVTIKKNVDASWSIGRYDKTSNSSREIHQYRGRQIGSTIVDYTNKIVATESLPGRWATQRYDDGTRVLTEFPENQPSFRVVSWPDGTFEVGIEGQ